MNLNVGVLGGGSWGTTVASMVARNTSVKLWARDEDTVAEINDKHMNSKYLPDLNLHRRLKATSSFQEAVSDADVLVMGVPSHSFRAVLQEVAQYLRPWVPVISLTKGLEKDTNLRMTQVISEVLPGHPVGVLTGPNLAREIAAGQAAASVLAMSDPQILDELQFIFHSGLFRVYTNDDLIGCELGGVMKNVIAIAVGMGDAMGAGENTRAAMITRGLAEITRLGVAMGGKAETFAGLAGMGDMIATCTSDKSRNHHVGVELGKGRSLREIMDEMLMVAEGVKSAPVVVDLARKYNVEMPISQDVLAVLLGKKTARQAFVGLLKTAVGSESDPG